MPTLRRFLSPLAVVLLVLTLASACGDGDTGAADQDTTDATVQATTTSPPQDEDISGDEREADEPATDTGGQAELREVRVEITSTSAGLDLQFAVTSDEVQDAANPAMVWIVCSGAASSNPGLLSGLYLVTAFDRYRESGLRHVGIEALEEVDGPGTYDGVVEVNDSAGRFVSVEGGLTINPDGRSGTLVGTDDDGNDMTVVYRCEV